MNERQYRCDVSFLRPCRVLYFDVSFSRLAMRRLLGVTCSPDISEVVVIRKYQYLLTIRSIWRQLPPHVSSCRRERRGTDKDRIHLFIITLYIQINLSLFTASVVAEHEGNHARHARIPKSNVIFNGLVRNASHVEKSVYSCLHLVHLLGDQHCQLRKKTPLSTGVSSCILWTKFSPIDYCDSRHASRRRVRRPYGDVRLRYGHFFSADLQQSRVAGTLDVFDHLCFIYRERLHSY